MGSEDLLLHEILFGSTGPKSIQSWPITLSMKSSTKISYAGLMNGLLSKLHDTTFLSYMIWTQLKTFEMMVFMTIIKIIIVIIRN